MSTLLIVLLVLLVFGGLGGGYYYGGPRGGGIGFIGLLVLVLVALLLTGNLHISGR